MTTDPRADDQVEWKPGFTVRRDVGLRLGLIAPEVRLGRGRPAALAPAADPQPEPIEPPPLQPSHEDLVLSEAETRNLLRAVGGRTDVAVAAIGEALGFFLPPVVVVETPPPRHPSRAPKPRPAKRPLDAILAEAERGFRAKGGRP